MIHFFHRLFNYHCDECRHSCESCETLREQLAIANADRNFLLRSLIEPRTTQSNEQPKTYPEPIVPKNVPWRIRREMLEAQDRAKAEIMKKKELEIAEANKSTEELEAELGITENAS